MATQRLQKLAQQFKALHVPGNPLVLTNVWDGCTASMVASLPATKAIATASYAIGAAIGLEDENLMTLEQNLDGVKRVLAGVRLAGKLDTLPVTADLIDGFADPAVSVKQALELGVVGCNIEDADYSGQAPRLRTLSEATERIRAAVQSARDVGVSDFVVNARTDVLKYDGTLGNAIERGQSYLDAGATTVFVLGGPKHKLTTEDVRRLVKELVGKVAVLAQGSTVASLRECGVSRISIGPTLLRRALKYAQAEAESALQGDWTM